MVNARHINRLAGKLIQDLQDITHTKLIFASQAIQRRKYDFYKGRVIYTLYTDDSISTELCPKEISNIMPKIYKNFDIIEEGTLWAFLGVNIER